MFRLYLIQKSIQDTNQHYSFYKLVFNVISIYDMLLFVDFSVLQFYFQVYDLAQFHHQSQSYRFHLYLFLKSIQDTNKHYSFYKLVFNVISTYDKLLFVASFVLQAYFQEYDLAYLHHQSQSYRFRLYLNLKFIQDTNNSHSLHKLVFNVIFIYA